MPSAAKTLTTWPTAAHQGLTFNVIRLGALHSEHDAKSEGGWIYLKGFEVLVGEQYFNAHITITKPLTSSPDFVEWHLCHLTVESNSTGHVFYNVDDDGIATTTTNLLGRDGRVTNGSEHYRKNQINDPALARSVRDDLAQIFLELV